MDREQCSRHVGPHLPVPGTRLQLLAGEAHTHNTPYTHHTYKHTTPQTIHTPHTTQHIHIIHTHLTHTRHPPHIHIKFTHSTQTYHTHTNSHHNPHAYHTQHTHIHHTIHTLWEGPDLLLGPAAVSPAWLPGMSPCHLHCPLKRERS